MPWHTRHATPPWRARIGGRDVLAHRAVDQQRRRRGTRRRSGSRRCPRPCGSVDDEAVDRVVEAPEGVGARSPVGRGLRVAARAALGLGDGMSRVALRRRSAGAGRERAGAGAGSRPRGACRGRARMVTTAGGGAGEEHAPASPTEPQRHSRRPARPRTQPRRRRRRASRRPERHDGAPVRGVARRAGAARAPARAGARWGAGGEARRRGTEVERPAAGMASRSTPAGVAPLVAGRKRQHRRGAARAQHALGRHGTSDERRQLQRGVARREAQAPRRVAPGPIPERPPLSGGPPQTPRCGCPHAMGPVHG